MQTSPKPTGKAPATALSRQMAKRRKAKQGAKPRKGFVSQDKFQGLDKSFAPAKAK